MQPRGSTEGYHYLYAITTRGHILPKVIVLKPGVDPRIASARMWAYLDETDQPYLALVKPAPAPASAPAYTARELAQLAIEDDPIRRMLHQRKRWAKEGRLPKIPFFRD